MELEKWKVGRGTPGSRVEDGEILVKAGGIDKINTVKVDRRKIGGAEKEEVRERKREGEHYAW